MTRRRFLSAILLILVTVACLFANDGFIYGMKRKKLSIPDIPGFMTMKCDLHMHSVFSDGEVWPDVRANEIWLEGLDAFSVTDHLEWNPHSDVMSSDMNKPHAIASAKAKELGILEIPGAEITRDFPAGQFTGHFVALFIQDANTIHREDISEEVKAASDQGAFVFWAHPVAVPLAEVDELVSGKYVNGVEIVNEYSYNANADGYAKKNKLPLIGNTDIHQPSYNVINGHRTMTLAFVKTKDEGGLREALFAGRTVVYSTTGTLYGYPEYLKSLFDASVTMVKQKMTVGPEAPAILILKNTSDIQYKVIFEYPASDISMPTGITIAPNGETRIKISKGKTVQPKGIKEVPIKMTISNCIIGTSKTMTEIPLSIPVVLSIDYL